MERPIRYLRENFLYGRDFLGDADLDARAKAGLDDVANVRLHRTTREQRDTDAAERFFRVLLGHAGTAPERINTDKLGSYAAAIRRLPELAAVDHQQVRAAERCNNRVEQAHQPTPVRERRMGRFRCPTSAQRFLAAITRTWNLFRRRRRSFTAPEYQVALQERFAAWRVAAELRP